MILLKLFSFYMLVALSVAGSLRQPGQGEIQARGTKTTPLYYQLASAVKYSTRPVKLVPDGWYVQSFHLREQGRVAEQWGLVVGYVSSTITRSKAGLSSWTLDYKARLYSVSWIPPKGEIPGQGLDDPPKWETPGHWVWGSQPWKGAWNPANTQILFLGGTTASRADQERLKRASESWVQRAGDRRDYNNAKNPDTIPIDQLPFSKKGYTQYMGRILSNDDKFEGTPAQPPVPTRTQGVKWKPPKV
ncbi:hypothetical protein LX32DRAFT_150499 [Colletotrichum zoysiae]|uniref:Cholera enterotoxin subunit A2 n=1 Tax=Colletotrichum zoysiae TaxID=1216348 RepID=A0AAD9HWB8_9PEZI|nr:hypothetical protein LX32DRAFT_150499 [Colletotrichum zoysiae]